MSEASYIKSLDEEKKKAAAQSQASLEELIAKYQNELKATTQSLNAGAAADYNAQQPVNATAGAANRGAYLNRLVSDDTNGSRELGLSGDYYRQMYNASVAGSEADNQNMLYNSYINKLIDKKSGGSGGYYRTGTKGKSNSVYDSLVNTALQLYNAKNTQTLGFGGTNVGAYLSQKIKAAGIKGTEAQEILNLGLYGQTTVPSTKTKTAANKPTEKSAATKKLEKEALIGAAKARLNKTK